jgi:hypothetical protein
MNLKNLERYLRVTLLGPGSSSYKKNYLPGRGLTKVGKHWLTPDVDVNHSISVFPDSTGLCNDIF